MNIKELINLAGEQGKVVVLGEDGEVKGVFLVYNEFQKLNAIKSIRAEKTPQDVAEEINREITQAQLADTIDAENKNLETIEPDLPKPQPLGDLLSKRAEQLFNDKPFGRSAQPAYDMRSEVIDPNFHSAPQPIVESDTEEIKPEFDDI